MEPASQNQRQQESIGQCFHVAKIHLRW
jgi:hypothetical protein